MNGAETLLRAAADAGLTVCFANPGTTEMHLVEAFDLVPAVRPVLCLFEGVATGAADGYGRMTGRPALTLLHLGPGLANGLANLHNARRARTPVVNLIGDHATWHRYADAPLASDIEGLARPVSAWVGTATSAPGLGLDLVGAAAAAIGPPGGVSTLVVPQDLTWADVPSPPAIAPLEPVEPVAPHPAVLGRAADALRRPGSILYLGDDALDEAGLRAAESIRAVTGCEVRVEGFSRRLERGGDLPSFPRLAYFPEHAQADLRGAPALVCCGAPPPVAFFGYPDGISSPVDPQTEVLLLAGPGAGAVALAELSHGRQPPTRRGDGTAGTPGASDGALTVGSLGRALAAGQPEGAIVVEEGATSMTAYSALAANAPRHSVISLTGGAIGQGLPSALGAAVACPDRTVIALQADGSGLYTAQALWTMAREQVDVTVVLCANRAYRILQHEFGRAASHEPGARAASLMRLDNPPIDWVALSGSFGVDAVSVETVAGFKDALRIGLAEHGPFLIEAVLN